jgi:hypothetical protein
MNTTFSRHQQLDSVLHRIRVHRGLAFGVIIIGALLALIPTATTILSKRGTAL